MFPGTPPHLDVSVCYYITHMSILLDPSPKVDTENERSGFERRWKLHVCCDEQTWLDTVEIHSGRSR